MILLKRRSFLRLAAALLPSSLLAETFQAPAAVQATSTPPEPQPIHRDEDRYAFKRILPGGTTSFKVSSQDCRNDFFAMEHHHQKKGGPPRHLHHNEDEWFYVIDGDYLVEIGSTLYTLKTGDSILGPRGVSHAFAYNGTTSGRFLITYAPAGRMEEFFDSRDRAGGRTTYVNDAAKMREYGMELLGPPLTVS